jgi:hypothetical protein
MRIRTIVLAALGVVAVRALAHQLRPAVLVTTRAARDGDTYDDVLDDVEYETVNRSHGYVPTEDYVREGRP